MAPPPYISSEPVKAIYGGPAPPVEINEIGHDHQSIPRVFVEFDGEVYAVEAEVVRPLESAA